MKLTGFLIDENRLPWIYGCQLLGRRDMGAIAVEGVPKQKIEQTGARIRGGWSATVSHAVASPGHLDVGYSFQRVGYFSVR